MTNSWLRLWHDMPNDPKWRTIARVSATTIPEVISVYLHLLVEASNATERGRTQPNIEDIASALDITIERVESIVGAMQGRVIDGDQITGWEKRQPKREDNSADRSKKWREEQKQTQTNADERNRPLEKRREEEIREEQIQSTKPAASKSEKLDTFTLPDWIELDTWDAYLEIRKGKGAKKTTRAWKLVIRELERLRSEGYDPNEILSTSVRSNWTDVYRPKTPPPPKKAVYREMTEEEASAAWQRDFGVN